ncbi:MAG: glutaredoxin-related protein [Bradymonadia bacterium]|jgi:glutaredoxin-related protein
MSRHVLPEDKIHPAIRERVNNSNRGIVDEVLTALATNPTVVVGMSLNPSCKKACSHLASRDLPFKYLEYGGYHNEWRRRNALKMWAGWPTFPMVFHKGVLIGGAENLEKFLKDGGIAG